MKYTPRPPNPGPAEPLLNASADGDGVADLVDLGQVVRPPARRGGISGPVAIAAAMIVIVGGLVLAGRPDLATTAASPSPSASGSAPDGAIASPWPGEPATGPTKRPVPGPTCVPVIPRFQPNLVLRWGSGSWDPVYLWDTYAKPREREDWTELFDRRSEISPDHVMRVADLGRIELASRDRLCIASWSVTYVKIDGPNVLTSVHGGSGRPDPTQESVTFIAPPVGDWLVHLIVELPSEGDSRWIEAFTRLRVGDWPIGPAAEVEPLAPCGPDDAAPGVALLIDGEPSDGAPLPAGATPPPTTTLIAVPLGSALLATTNSDRCAIGWSIDLIPRPDQGLGDRGPEQLAWYDNAALDPTVAAQNRFPIGVGPAGGDWDLVGRFTFVGGATLDVVWPLRVEAFAVPPLHVRRQGQTAFVNAWVGCGFSMSLRNGYETSDSCGSNLPQEPLETLVVKRGDRLTFDTGAWSTSGWWSAQTGVFRGEGPSFVETEGGFLRSASSPPVDFPAPPSVGTWTVSLGTCVVRDGNQVCGQWFVNVEVR